VYIRVYAYHYIYRYTCVHIYQNISRSCPGVHKYMRGYRGITILKGIYIFIMYDRVYTLSKPCPIRTGCMPLSSSLSACSSRAPASTTTPVVPSPISLSCCYSVYNTVSDNKCSTLEL
jgi:hypothetical protein